MNMSMLIYHTSDWHLGRMLYGRSLLSDQRFFLETCLLPMVERERPAALLLSGDIYDRQVPPVEAIRLLDETLNRLVSLNCKVLMIAGNHDGADRIALMKRALRQSGVYLSTEPADALEPVVLTGGSETVQAFLLPYSTPAEVRAFISREDLRGESACMEALLQKLRPLFLPGAVHILLSHCFTAGASVCDSESVFVGGSAGVPPALFSDFDYVALGHLHGPQKMGEGVRYSGSPLKYSVSEADQRKGFLRLEISEGRLSVSPIGTVPLRDLRRVKGSFSEVLAGPFSEDYVEVELTDPDPVLMAAEQLRSRFPNLLSVRNSWTAAAAAERSRGLRGRDEEAVFTAFLRDVCKEEPDEGDLALFRAIYQEVKE